MYVLVYSKTGKNLFLTRTQIKEKSDNNTCYPKPHARISINTPNHRNHFTPWVTVWRNIIYHKINTPVHLISIASDAEDSRWTRCKQNIEGKSRKTHAHVEDLFAFNACPEEALVCLHGFRCPLKHRNHIIKKKLILKIKFRVFKNIYLFLFWRINH